MAEANLIEKLKARGVITHNHRNVVYKYMDIMTAMHILTGRTLMFTRPDNFNDPFEIHMGLLDFDFPQEDVVGIYERHFNKGNRVDDKLREHLVNNGKEFIIESTTKVFEEFRKNVGVTCFAKRPNNALMWAHYAAKHKGVCLGFTIPGHNRARDAFEVNYVNTIKPIKFYNDDERLLSFWYWVFTKSHVWEYEQEVRLASLLSSGVQDFDGIEVVEVYFGASTTADDEYAINSVTGYHPSLKKLAKMEISPKTFDLTETPFDA